MKKLLYILPAAALTLGLQSCSDDDFTKHSIDADYQTGTTTTISTTADPVVEDFETVTFAVALSSVEDVLEQGVQVSTSEDFSNPIYFTNTEELATEFTISTTGLEGSTTYYARSYAITKAGGYIYGAVQTFTTPKTPIYELEGFYLMQQFYAGSDTDYEFIPDSWEDEEGVEHLVYYYILLEKDPESTDGTELLIYNLWERDPTFQSSIHGEYDEESQLVFIPNQIIGEYPPYGAVGMRGVNAGITAYTTGVEMQFTPMKGLLKSTNFNVFVSAGSFGYYYIDGSHVADEE